MLYLPVEDLDSISCVEVPNDYSIHVVYDNDTSDVFYFNNHYVTSSSDSLYCDNPISLDQVTNNYLYSSYLFNAVHITFILFTIFVCFIGFAFKSLMKGW